MASYTVEGPIEEPPEQGMLDTIKGIITNIVKKIARVAVVILVVLEIFVSGAKEQRFTQGVLAELPEADFTPEDYELLEVLYTHAVNTERKELELHRYYADRNGQVIFQENADVTVRHIAYRASPFQIDITYELGKDREIQLCETGDEYRKVVMVFDNVPGRLLGPIFGRFWASTWGTRTCYICRYRAVSGEVLARAKSVYRHNWFGWWAKVRDWDRTDMLAQM